MKLAVRHQMPFKWKRAAALLTHEWSIARMYTQMGQQVVLEGEAFLALATLIGTLGGVQQQMRVETVLVGEVFAAMRTNVGSFACKKRSVCLVKSYRVQPS